MRCIRFCTCNGHPTSSVPPEKRRDERGALLAAIFYVQVSVWAGIPRTYRCTRFRGYRNSHTVCGCTQTDVHAKTHARPYMHTHSHSIDHNFGGYFLKCFLGSELFSKGCIYRLEFYPVESTSCKSFPILSAIFG